MQVLTLTGTPLVQRVVDVAVEEGAQEVVIGLPTRSVGALPGVVAERLVIPRERRTACSAYLPHTHACGGETHTPRGGLARRRQRRSGRLHPT